MLSRLVAPNDKPTLFAQALQDWSTYITKDPHDPYSFERRAEVFMSLRKFDEAEADYDRAIELDKKSAISYNGRGTLRLKKEISSPYLAYKPSLWKQILSDFDTATKLAPSDAAVWCNLGQAALQSNDLGRAKNALNRCQVLATDPATRSWAAKELLLTTEREGLGVN